MQLKNVTRISWIFCLLALSAIDPGLARAQPPQVAARPSPPRRIHPQPNTTHAGVRYEQAFATGTDVDPVVRCLEGPVPESILGLDKEITLSGLRVALAESLPIPVAIDIRALEDLGLDPEIPIWLEGIGGRMTLGGFLDRVLNPLDLSITTLSQTLSITTKEAAVGNRLVAHYPFPTTIADSQDMARLVDTIQATIASESWDVVGGENAIRVAPEANELVIAADLQTHCLLGSLIRSGFDSDLEPALGESTEGPTFMPLRSYGIHSNDDVSAIGQWIRDTTNAALGPQADPDGQVSVFAGRLIVQSRSRPFHVYAAEVIRAINGIEVSPKIEGGDGAMSTHQGFCWVAREVYGIDNPRWLVFRAWMMSDAPLSVRDAYEAYGEEFAHWLARKPVAKVIVRRLMDQMLAAGVKFRD